MRITVFTPTFNRSHTLRRLYDSLCRQTLLDFEWVVVDDASTDGTMLLIEEFRSGFARFPITYLQMKVNGGKHRAINRGVGVARGELFFIVDSDDFLPDDALEAIDAVEKSIREHERPRFAGVCGLKGDLDGGAIGSTFEGNCLDITTLERQDYGISGDKAEIVYTRVMRSYPFPEFAGENFITEAAIWDRIAKDGLEFRFFNSIVSTCEYLEDGLSTRYRQLLLDNPRGHGLFIKQSIAVRGLSPKRAIARRLLYYDDHKNHATMADLSENLGIHPRQMRSYLFMRRVRRWLKW